MAVMTDSLARMFGGLVLCLALAAAAAPARADDGDLSLSYAISIAGIPVGRADAEGRFRTSGYSIAIRGFTSGVSRLVSDATALMASNGRISGTKVIPANFSLETTENGAGAEVTMVMRGRAITDVDATPGLAPRPDRVPVTASHKRDVVDPVSAFIVALSKDGPVGGETACNRTIRVFDGWQRFDVELTFQRTRNVQGDASTYSGQVIVCSARYVPVAGHRPSQESVQFMASNTNLEAWLMPVRGHRLMLPYQLVIGTNVGDLVIRLLRYSNQMPETRASLQ